MKKIGDRFLDGKSHTRECSFSKIWCSDLYVRNVLRPVSDEQRQQLMMGWLSCLPQNNQEDCSSQRTGQKHAHLQNVTPSLPGINMLRKHDPTIPVGSPGKINVCWETMTPNFLQDHHDRSKLCLRKQALSVVSSWQKDLFAKRKCKTLKGSPSQIKHIFARKMDDPKICVGSWWPRAVAGWSTTAESVTETKVGGQHLPFHPNLSLPRLCIVWTTRDVNSIALNCTGSQYLSWFITPHSAPAASTAAVQASVGELAGQHILGSACHSGTCSVESTGSGHMLICEVVNSLQHACEVAH